MTIHDKLITLNRILERLGVPRDLSGYWPTWVNGSTALVPYAGGVFSDIVREDDIRMWEVEIAHLVAAFVGGFERTWGFGPP